MLDKNTATLLALLNKIAGECYKVISKQELVEQLPKTDVKKLEETVALLHNNGYVNVKYEDDADYCLRVTDKTTTYFSSKKLPVERTKIDNLQLALLLALVFVTSFLGTLLAIIIGKLL